MDILLRMPIAQKVKSPDEIEETEKRKPTAKESALWAVLEQLKGGYSSLNAVEVGVPNAKYKLMMVAVFGVTLKEMEAAIAKFGEDWRIIHAEDDGLVDVVDPDTKEVRQEMGRVYIRKGITTDLLEHTADDHDYDTAGKILATRKATVPVIGCWAGKEWRL